MNIRNLALLTFLRLSCLVGSFGQDSTGDISDRVLPMPESANLSSSIYYNKKLEFSLETGWLPINIPFVFDCFVGDSYNETPLQYTLAPILASYDGSWAMCEA